MFNFTLLIGAFINSFNLIVKSMIEMSEVIRIQQVKGQSSQI